LAYVLDSEILRSLAPSASGPSQGTILNLAPKVWDFGSKKLV
jgi:hypothetical protein